MKAWESIARYTGGCADIAFLVSCGTMFPFGSVCSFDAKHLNVSLACKAHFSPRAFAAPFCARGLNVFWV